MLNKVHIQGRLTADPELRHTQSNKPVASFSLACEQDFKQADGTRKTDFFNCTAWNGTAEFVSRYFHKGDMMIVSGRLQQRQWTDKEGSKRSTVEIVADNVYFGGSKKEQKLQEFAPLPDDTDVPFAFNENEGDLPF